MARLGQAHVDDALVLGRLFSTNESRALKPVDDSRHRRLGHADMTRQRTRGWLAFLFDCLHDEQLRRRQPGLLHEPLRVKVSGPHYLAQRDQDFVVVFHDASLCRNRAEYQDPVHS
jgi:hypothetical protein